MSPRPPRIAALLGLGAALWLAPVQAQAQEQDRHPPASADPEPQRPAPLARKSPRPPAEAVPGGRKAPPGVPQAQRWTEDWSQPPAPGASIVERLRHVPLGADEDVYLSIGGEARAYYTDWQHATLGLRADDDNSLVQSRLRLLADLHLGPQVRAYVELGDNREFGEEFATAANRDKLDLYQAFVDVTLPLGEAGRLTLRPGRFEMPLGNGKLVGTREALNMRFTYQGVRATYILPGRISVDAFATRPIAVRPGTFDDRGDPARVFHGVYVSAPDLFAGLGADLYWYEMKRQAATLREGAGADERDTLGGRLWRRDGGVDVDLEAALQRGTFAGQDIRAWSVLMEAGYTWAALPLKPRLGLRADAFSGDDDLADGTAGTFVAAAPRLPMLSEGAFLNFSNLVDLYPSLTLKPHEAVSVMVGPQFLWRQSRADGVYVGPAGASFAPYGTARRIGTTFNLEASWQVTRRFGLRLFETRFEPGTAFEKAGGRQANYFGLQTNYRF